MAIRPTGQRTVGFLFVHDLATFCARGIAAYRRTTPQALAVERCNGQGPKYRKLGSRVYYDWADVTAWVEAHTVTPTPRSWYSHAAQGMS